MRRSTPFRIRNKSPAALLPLTRRPRPHIFGNGPTAIRGAAPTEPREEGIGEA